jgi:hypothetical protein
MKTQDEMFNAIINLRAALIEIQSAAWAFKGNSGIIPESVDAKLLEIEKKCETVLAGNKAW